ncbi:MAG: DivIVA domain-containing protein [Solirubrobacteraceae bacterium]
MALDRQSIERKDFPLGQRGYDPDAVDAHLAALADEVDEFKQQARRRSDALASSASEQVRSIVDAAERSAAEIQRQAEDDARETRDEAVAEARTIAERAQEEARAHVAKVSEAADGVLERLERMEHELQGLVDELRAGRDRFGADVSHLRDELSGVASSATPRPRFEPEAAPASASPYGEAPAEGAVYAPPEPGAHGEEPPMYMPPEPGTHGEEPPMYMPPEPGAQGEQPPMYAPPEPSAHAEEPPAYMTPSEGDQVPAYMPEPDADVGYDASAAQRINAGYGDSSRYGESEAAAPQPATPAPEYTYDPYAAHPVQESDDTEGARLIALNMALNGTPREETERYLAENFQLSDARGLLDEVYASVEG